ncbi:hypothetical protein BJ322DRAFT_1084565 [Thelephora terrestris]|uniref:Uncharacterized protein n=1 Tax=Thelephora terrestris TaxID=56493 RepID=A0A9P6L340_9AGAM|nr:hypothetical protein BJ322DRAFT_1084565 [Thelephora terrestris]
MVLHPDTITAIINNWDAPKYDGSQDVRPWLRAMEEICRIYGIPLVQMTEMAIKCTAGQASPVLTAMFDARVAEAGGWLWVDFKQCVIQIEDNYRRNMRDAPRDVTDGDFRSKHPYATAALAVTLIGVGTAVVIPAMTIGILGVIGFGPAGVAGGSFAAFLQSAICGGATGGAFSVFQSLGATMVAPSLISTFAGVGTAAAGTWLGLTSSITEDPPAVDN